MNKTLNWDEYWTGVDVYQQPLLEEGIFSKMLDSASSKVSGIANKSAIEIGCYPGKFIEYIGRKGYTISGIDTHTDVEKITHWATSKGHQVGNFEKCSLQEYANTHSDCFDLVFSLGLIEHFDDFCDVLYSHGKLCNENGILLIGAPNFASPYQRALHSVLDQKNLEGHVLHSMYSDLWAIYLSLIGFDVQYSGNWGGFGFWSDSVTDDNRIVMMQNHVSNIANTLNQYSGKFNQSETSYNIVIAKRTSLSQIELTERHLKASMLIRKIAHSISDKDMKLSLPMIQLMNDLLGK